MGERLAIDGGPPVRTDSFGPTHEFGDADVAAIAEVLHSGNVGKGPRVDRFEWEFTDRHGVAYGVTVNSETAAMHTWIGAIDPDPGDEIITTPWTSGGTIIGTLLHNCVPVFADIDDTYNLDPEDVEKKITPRTRAIMPVHLFGNPCDMTALRDIADRHGLYLIEDCCQSPFAEHQGQVVGTFGDIAGFSFGGKHLSAGMGGIVLTDNRSLWERAILFRDAALPRDNGPFEGRPYANYFLAPNYKINDVIAALLLSQPQKVDGYIENKIRDAHNIIDGLADIAEIVPQRVREGDRHTYLHFGFTIDTDVLGFTAPEFAEAVTVEGVPLAGPYLGTPEHGPLYRNPFLAEPRLYGKSHFPLNAGRDGPVDYRKVVCPVGEELMGRGVNFSMLPTLTENDVSDIILANRKVALSRRG